jgi:hypothetical protein
LLPEHTLRHSTLDPDAPDEMYRVGTPIFLMQLLLVH